MEKTSELLIYLMACSLQGAKPEESMLSNADLEALLRLARAHSVSAMVCMALEQTDVFRRAEESIRLKWLEVKNKAVRKNMLLDAERAALENEFVQRKIWYMPLKGSILKEWYPKFGMREMADNDILFDAAKRQEVNEIFLNRGYVTEVYGKSNHDVYKKPPIYNFEMHVELYHKIYDKFNEKYNDVKQRLLPDAEASYRFNFTPEDLYVSVIAHAYKHYSSSGTGVRTLADTYVMNRKLGKSLNRDYVESELRELGILEYERESRELTQKLFEKARPLSEAKLTETEQQMLAYYLGASTYGTIQNRILHTMQKMQPDGEAITARTKLKYMLLRMFPGREFCEESAPTVYKYPVLLPLFWARRLAVKLFTRSKFIKQELDAIKQGK